jgi:hypothetical protein
MRKDSSPLAASFRCGTPVIFAPEKREGSAYLLAEAPKFLIGYHAEFSNDRDLKNRRRTSEISKCMFDICREPATFSPKIPRGGLSRWIESSTDDLLLQQLPVTYSIAVETYALPEPFHCDPDGSFARFNGVDLSMHSVRIPSGKGFPLPRRGAKLTDHYG